ncbi:MAG: hypothetical protein V1861_01660, partial [Candidatus Micrarchaeota archaeon]
YQNTCLAQAANSKIAYSGICQSNATAAEALCTDSDSGKNLIEKGTTQAKGQNQSEDFCVNEGSLQEGYCDSGAIKVETMECPEGTVCDDGRCTSDICSDSDGGSVPKTKGTLEKGQVSISDICSDAKHVIEQFCSDNTAMNTTIECGSMEGCSDGRCVKQSVCSDSDGGNDAYETGTATTDEGSFTDFCKDNSTINEYWCDGNSLEQTTAACGADYWCSGGECVYQNCLDSDAGKDKRISGQVSKGGITSYDGCIDSDTVKEFYCEANDAVSVEMNCGSDEICASGRCVEASCVDSDGGNVPLTSGTVSIGSVSKMDECTNLTILKEYRCDGGDYTYSNVDCFTHFSSSVRGICWNRVCAQTYCMDSDGGRNENVSGSATMTTVNGYANYVNDECAESYSVAEYFCDSNWLIAEKVPCSLEQYCFMGHCVDSPCVDSDGGADYIEAGSVTKGRRSEDDECLDSNTLREWTCSGNNVVNDDHACPAGCDEAGRRCVPL